MKGSIHFIEKYMKLRGEPINLYEYQKEFLKDKSPFRIFNKSPQIGISQLVALEALYIALSEKNKTIPRMTLIGYPNKAFSTTSSIIR